MRLTRCECDMQSESTELLPIISVDNYPADVSRKFSSMWKASVDLLTLLTRRRVTLRNLSSYLQVFICLRFVRIVQ